MSNGIASYLSLALLWVGLLGLAAFLALFWVLRGAPIGQSVVTEDDEASPRGGYRDRVIAAVTVGMLLILSGGYLAVTKGVAWSLPAFGLGFALVLTLVLLNQRHRHASPTLRRTLGVSTAAINLTLVAGSLVVVNVIAFRYGGQPIDMTRERAHTLSSLTVNQLKGLNRPVTFTTFFGRSPTSLQQKDRVDQLLDLYRTVNPEKVRLDHVDPFREQTRYDALAARVKDVEITQGGGVVIEVGEGDATDHAVVRNVDLFPPPPASAYDPESTSVSFEFTGEDAITSALIRLREATRPLLIFTTGHGELSPDETDVAKPGVGVWKSRLMATGWAVGETNLLKQELPAETSLVVVAGPATAFKPEEVAKLRAYSERKGPLLLLVDDAETVGLNDFLKGFNVEAPGGIVVEPRQNYRGQQQLLLLPVDRQTQPILEPLNNKQLIIPGASPLKTIGSAAGARTASALLSTVLLRTSGQSWALTRSHNGPIKKGPNDPNGPFPIAIALTDNPATANPKPEPGLPAKDVPTPASAGSPTPRLVIVSSRYLASNSYVMGVANLDLLMNSANWLRGRDDQVGIAPHVHESISLSVDPVLHARLILVPTVMAGLLIIVLGVTTYIARRS